MIALVDANSFFCSVEKVFHPGLEGKPTCVLSSNDGCIVALTPEAKAIGLHRGDPIFKVRDIVERNKVGYILHQHATLCCNVQAHSQYTEKFSRESRTV